MLEMLEMEGRLRKINGEREKGRYKYIAYATRQFGDGILEGKGKYEERDGEIMGMGSGAVGETMT